MAGYLLCLTAAGGVPVFTRKVGEVSTLPFPLIGSLNGVHIFANSHHVQVISTSSERANIVWKEFHESIVLIAILGSDNGSDEHILRFLDLIFASLVLLIGQDAIIRFKSVERVKKDIRCCFRLLDSLLSHIVSPHHHISPFKITTHASECFLVNDVNILQGCLELFVESSLSTYGCLLIDGQIVVATKKWWSLMEHESVLLAAFVHCCPPATSRDIPIYLPCSSPTVPHRLLTFQLCAKTEVCILCGTTPSLSALKNNAVKLWKSSYETLKTAIQSVPGELPKSWCAERNILGIFLLNTADNKSICAFHPHDREGSRGNWPSRKDRVNILYKFYSSVVGTLFPIGSNTTTESKCIFKMATETYIYAECFKCYAVRDEQYQLFVLYNDSIPYFATRSTTADLFNLLVKKIFR